jgi:hypothetical protein
MEDNNMNANDTANESEGVFTTVYERYSRQIDKEDELIDRRVNWLLTSQSILFAAFGLSGEAIAVIVQSVVPWVGLASSLLIGATIWAASLSLVRYRKALIMVCRPSDDPESHFPQLHRDKTIITLGLLPSLFVPFIFCVAWTTVILM